MIRELLVMSRGAAFWFLDLLKGRKIKIAYNDIKKMYSLDSLDYQVSFYQKQVLTKLLKYAVENTKFYSDLEFKQSLNDYPVINKNIIKEKQHEFLSKDYSIEQLVVMSTSGSTGTPFLAYQDKDKKKRVTAEIIYYSEKAGYRVGSNLIFLRALTDKSKKSSLQQWIQNETLIDISNLNDNAIEIVLRKINEVSTSGSMILAYASTYDMLKDYFNKNKFSKSENSSITGIISGSEMLFDDTRRAMSEAFDCKCISRYSNQENGIIGQDDNENNVFVINEANYIVEIFKTDEDILAEEGEVGRIVITDLYNYAMPMIRYDTGDIGSIKIVELKNGIKKKAITNFGGRKVDVVYDSKGDRLSPHIITNNLWSFPEIKQYQFIQTDLIEYLVKINVNGLFERENELILTLKKLLGEKAEITIERVSEIPVMASGKRKYIINEIK